MAITLKANVRWGGVDYAPGATIPGLTPSDEAGLVSSNRAEWVGTPSTNSNAAVPVMATTGPGGGLGIPVGSTGLMLPATLLQQPNQLWPAARPAYDGPITLIGWSDPPAWAWGAYDQFVQIPRINAPIIEDFTSYDLGTPPAGAFDQYWAASYTSITIAEDVRTDAGRALVLVAAPGTGSSLVLIGNSTIETDQEILAEIIEPVPAIWSQNCAGLALRCGLDSTSREGYFLTLRSTATLELRLYKFVANISTLLETVVLDTTLSTAIKGANKKAWMRFRADGTTLTGTVWADGTSEPVTPQISKIDASLVSGRAGFTSASNLYTYIIGSVSIAYGGQVAPKVS